MDIKRKIGLLSVIESVLFILIIIYIFIDYKITIVLFLIGGLVRVLPLGPNYLLLVISGYLLVGGTVYLFIDWKIAFLSLLLGYVVSRFRLWSIKAVKESNSK